MTVRVYLDTNVFIDAFESTGPRSDQTWQIFEAIAADRLHGVTSELTLAELLPMPLVRSQSDLVATYKDLIRHGGLLEMIPVGRDILIEAAQLRAGQPGLKLPDAVHVATALTHECPVFVSGDLRVILPPRLRAARLGPDCIQTILRPTA